MTRHTLTTILGLLLLTTATAHANGGNVRLSPGFLPDPQVLSYQAGGSVDAFQYEDNNFTGEFCGGYINNTPDHIMTLNDDFAYLRIAVNSNIDTTLVIVNNANNRVYCFDDQEGFNPVAEGPWAAGQYQIYVGNYFSADSYDAYTITFTERTDSPVPVIGNAAATNNTPVIANAPTNALNHFNLNAGFAPDPYVYSGFAGGSIDASFFQSRNVSDTYCTGYIYDIPDHRMTLGTDFAHLHLWIESESDTTLVIVTPDNTVYCYDDAESGFGEFALNPSVTGLWEAGTYDIYVGSYNSSQTYADYTLKVSEIY